MDTNATRRNRRRYEWKPEHLALLGTMSDHDVAERIGGKAETVLAKRQAMGVKPFKPETSPIKGKPRPNFDWNDETVKLLGTMTDSELAKQLGLANTTVAAKRRSLGIPGRNERLPEIVIPPNLRRKLGKWSDALIASKLGVAGSAVSRYRRKLGIAPIMEAKFLPPEADKLLGNVTDSAVAKQYGVSRTCVGNRRKALGIPKMTSKRTDLQAGAAP